MVGFPVGLFLSVIHGWIGGEFGGLVVGVVVEAFVGYSSGWFVVGIVGEVGGYG